MGTWLYLPGFTRNYNNLTPKSATKQVCLRVHPIITRALQGQPLPLLQRQPLHYSPTITRPVSWGLCIAEFFPVGASIYTHHR